MRLFGWFLLLAAPVLAQETGGAGGADPARFFPADTFAYAEVDASALNECLPAWQIAKIVTDPALKAFLAPTFEKLGIDQEKPLEALQKQFPTGLFLEGRAAIGVRGISTVVRDANGKEWKFRFSPEVPVNARDVYRWLGMMFALDAVGGQQVHFNVDVDFLAVGRPGPAGKQLVEAALEEIGGKVARTPVKVAGHDATHVHADVDVGWGISYGFNFYAAEQAGTWFLATQTDTLERALSGGPQTSLAKSPALATARAKFTSGRPLLFAHIGLGRLFEIYKGFLFPIAKDMGDIAGINAVKGVGLGISLVDGGVRESFGILLDGNPRGCWRILEGMPVGLRSIEVAPPRALAAVAVKLDWKVLLERLRGFIADVSPGCEDEVVREIAREMAPRGLDLVKEVVPALKDEIAVLVYPAGPNEMFPRFVLGVDGRDAEALARLVARIQGQIPAKVATFTPTELPEGIAAVRITVEDSPYELTYALHKGHFFLASNPRILGDVVTSWGAEGSPSLVRDDLVLPMVLKATNGGDTDHLAALAYVSLRGAAAEALKTLMLWGRLLPQEWFDPKGMGGLARIPNHLTGMAVALRHDKDGVILDCFSPVGLLVPATVTAALFARQRVVARQIAMPQRAGTGRPSLGITAKSSDGTGVKVLGLESAGAAAAGGLRQGDKLIGLGGAPIATIEDLDRELAKLEPGQSVELKIRRGDAEITVTVELGEEAGW